METLFLSMWNQLQVFSNNNDFVSYGALINSIKVLIKELLNRNVITLDISDDYNVIVYNIETHFGYIDIVGYFCK
jgi:hypothetical protein